MGELILIVVAFCLLMPVLVAGVFAMSMIGQGSPKARISVMADGLYTALAPQSQAHEAWAAEHGFEWDGAYVPQFPMNGQIPFFAWRNAEAATLMIAYFTQQGVQTDFVTGYAGGVGLTTGSSAAGMLTPVRPNNPKQAFTGLTIEQLWQKHVAADAFLRRQYGRTHELDDRPVDELMLESVRELSAFVRSLPLWPFRGVYWYFTMKGRTNIPVESQPTRWAA